MGKAVVGTCDVRGCPNTGDEVQTTQVIVNGQEWVADMCEEHLAPILTAMQAAAPRQRRASRDRVWTMEEIERLKNKDEKP